MKIFNLFKRKSTTQKEIDVLIKRLEMYAIEHAMLKQIVSDCIRENEGVVDTCNLLPSEEMDKYSWWHRKSDIRVVWGIVEKWCKEQKIKSELSK
jgi:hypothetical protein